MEFVVIDAIGLSVEPEDSCRAEIARARRCRYELDIHSKKFANLAKLNIHDSINDHVCTREHLHRLPHCRRTIHLSDDEVTCRYGGLQQDALCRGTPRENRFSTTVIYSPFTLGILDFEQRFQVPV